MKGSDEGCEEPILGGFCTASMSASSGQSYLKMVRGARMFGVRVVYVDTPRRLSRSALSPFMGVRAHECPRAKVVGMNEESVVGTRLNDIHTPVLKKVASK